MAGRAGRRGKDTQGNIIFYGEIDHETLMKGELPEIIGNKNSIYTLSDVHPKSQNLYLNMINKERKILTIEYEKNEKFKKLIWKLRKYPKISEF